MSLSVETDKQNNVITIKLTGILDISTASLFNQREIQLEDIDLMLIDFSQLVFIDSTGIGFILDILYLSEDQGFPIRFSGLKDDVKEIFETVGVFKILETLQRGGGNNA